eukprot:833758-Prorocentrum_minimum.AAC.2
MPITVTSPQTRTQSGGGTARREAKQHTDFEGETPTSSAALANEDLSKENLLREIIRYSQDV